MKANEDLILPAEARYTAEHVWMRPDGADWLAGITDYAQDQLGEVSFVDVAAGGHVDAGEEFGTVESVKSVNALYMPVSGTVLEANPALEDRPELVNEDCCGEGWIVRIRPDRAEDAETLLDAGAYRARLQN